MAVTVEYDEDRNSPKESLTMEGAVVIRTLTCSRAERLLLAKQLLGFWDSDSGGPTVYNAPDEYVPDGDEELPYVYANSVEIECNPEQADDTAKLTVTYKSMDISTIGEGEDAEQVYITERLGSASEFITVSRKGLGFGTGVDRIDLTENDLEAPAAVHCMIEWEYTIHHIPTLDSAYFDLVGKINNAAVYSRALNITFPTGTLLCANPIAEREITLSSIPMWSITYRFMYQNNGTIAAPKGWNYFTRTDNADAGGVNFEPVTNESDASIPIYATADFSGVIR